MTKWEFWYRGTSRRSNFRQTSLMQPMLLPTASSLVKSTFYVNTQSAELTDNNTQRHRYGASLILDYTSDLVDVKLFNVYDQKTDSSITRDNTTNFNSREFYDQVFVNQTKTEQRTIRFKRCLSLEGRNCRYHYHTRKAINIPRMDMEFDFYQTGCSNDTNRKCTDLRSAVDSNKFNGCIQPGE